MRARQNCRRRRAGLGACLLGLAVAGSAFGQSDLRWRLAPEEQLEVVLSQTSSTEAEIAGKVYKSALQADVTLDWRVASVDETGVATIEQTLSRLIVAAELPGSPPVRYDSTSQERLTVAAKAVADEFRPLLGKPARLRLLPTGEIEDGAKESPNAPGGAVRPPPFSAKDVRQLLGRLLPAVPPEPVAPGDAWGDCREQATPDGAVKIAAQFNARGAELIDARPVEKIEATYEFSAPPGKEVTFAFEDQQNRGVFYFDAAAGRLVRGEIRQAMTLKLRVEDSSVAQKSRSVITIEVRPGRPPAGAATQQRPPRE